MTTTCVPTLQPDAASLPGDREARVLAACLRAHRLTLLHGAAGSGKTRLLERGVLPLLRRRAADVAQRGATQAPVVVPFPDRRGPGAGTNPGRAEVAIVFNAWHGAPLTALQARIDALLSLAPAQRPAIRLSLSASLATLSKLFGVRFLFIFDDFDACLGAAPQRSEARQFVNEMIHAARRPGLPAHFLLVLRDAGGPQLERLRTRTADIDTHTLQLGRGPDAFAPPALREVLVEQDASVPPTAPPVPTQALKDWYGVIDAIVAKAANAARLDAPPDRGEDLWANLAALQAAAVDAAPDAAPGDAPDDFIDEAAKPAPAAPFAAAATTAATPAPLRRAQPVRARALPMQAPASAPRRVLPASLGGLALVLVLTSLAYRYWPAPAEPPGTRIAAPTPSATPTAPPQRLRALPSPGSGETGIPIPPAFVAAATPNPPAPPTPALPGLGIVTDVEDGTDTRIAGELALALGPEASIHLRRLASAGWADALAGLHGQPRVAIVRYDALQAARRQGSVSGLQIVTPLYVDEIYVLVRADSELNYIHQIAGRRINVGPAGGSRALTAGALYERLFGTTLPATEQGALNEDAALARLLEGKSLDALLLVGARPSEWLSHLPAERLRALKLLKLDRANAASRKALQAYLPASLRWPGPAASEPVPTLGVMSFLVAAEPPDAAAAERLGRFAQALCNKLPVLQRDGHPKWREVQPGLRLEVGWPYAEAATQAYRNCQSASPQASPKPSKS